MKKLILLSSMLISGLVSAQTYPFSENFDAVTVSGTPQNGPLPTGWTTGAGSQFKVYGLENFQPHGRTITNACSVEMSASHAFDTLITPAIGPISANTQLTLYYRFVNKSGYPTTGTTLSANDKVTIDAFVGSTPYPAVATINSTSNPTPNTAYTAYTYTNSLFAFAGTNPVKLRMDVAWGAGDWYLDIDDVSIKDIGSAYGVKYNVFNPPALVALPNPSEGNFAVWLKNYQATNTVELKLYNNMGQLVKTIKPDNVINNQFNVNTTDLAKGVYMVEVISGNEISNTQVIVE
jgi:hypothetical protein